MAASGKPVKVLLAGDVGGALPALLKRVEAVNAKNGPFDMLICVGAFFPPGGDPEAEPPAGMLPYLTGEAQPPVPVYFIGAYGQGSSSGMRALQAAGSKSGLHYLGRAGVVDVKGLNLAFLDGRKAPKKQQPRREPKQSGGGGGEEGDGEAAAAAAKAAEEAAAAKAAAEAAGPGLSCPHYSDADLDLARSDLEQLAGDVDILLTCEWPEGVTGALPPDQAAAAGMQPAACSAAAADLAVLARPRYHAAGGQGVFYARAPYINPDLGAGPRATRFIGLAHVGNAGKQKSLHALALAPAAGQTPEQLGAVPEGATACPYGRDKAGGKRPAEDDGGANAGSWRFQQPKRPRGDRQQQQRGGGGGGGPGGGGAGPAVAWGNAGVVKDGAATVYVKNLSFSATVADVEGFFSQAGKVVDIRRGVDDNGRPNSWAHVQFESPEAAGRALQLSGAELLGRPLEVAPASQKTRGPSAAQAAAAAAPVDGCWFCLSSADVDVSLVASVGDESYVALDKGQIADSHVLVVPIEHYPSLVALPEAARDEIDRYLSGLRAAYAAQGLALVGFERHLSLRSKGGNHCHINVMGVGQEAAAGAREAFEQIAAAAGFELEFIPPKGGRLDRDALARAVGRGEYFLGLLPDGGALARPISRGERLPMDLGRRILATLGGAPDRADWRRCAKAGPAEEEAAAEAFKRMFKGFDPALAS